MGINNNFPHKVATLCAYFLMEQLPICDVAKTRTERSIIGALLPFLDARDFRTPITIVTRKKLGNLSGLGRSALYESLNELERKEVIKRLDDNAIRFTEKGVLLLEPMIKNSVESHDTNSKFFRVGKYRLPRECLKLINAGLSPVQVVTLMKHAKHHAKILQDVIASKWGVLEKYTELPLFRIIHALISGKINFDKSSTVEDEYKKLPKQIKLFVNGKLKNGIEINGIFYKAVKRDHSYWIETVSANHHANDILTVGNVSKIVQALENQVIDSVKTVKTITLPSSFGSHAGEWLLASIQNHLIELILATSDRQNKTRIFIPLLQLIDVTFDREKDPHNPSTANFRQEGNGLVNIGDVIAAEGAPAALVDSIKGGVVSLQLLEGVEAGRYITISLLKLANKIFHRFSHEEWNILSV